MFRVQHAGVCQKLSVVVLQSVCQNPMRTRTIDASRKEEDTVTEVMGHSLGVQLFTQNKRRGAVCIKN